RADLEEVRRVVGIVARLRAEVDLVAIEGLERDAVGRAAWLPAEHDAGQRDDQTLDDVEVDREALGALVPQEDRAVPRCGVLKCELDDLALERLDVRGVEGLVAAL